MYFEIVTDFCFFGDSATDVENTASWDRALEAFLFGVSDPDCVKCEVLQNGATILSYCVPESLD